MTAIIRPRLSQKEIVLLAEALKEYKAFLEGKQKAMEHREYHIKELRNEFIQTNNRDLFKELQHERELYSMDKTQCYHYKLIATNILLRRFQAMPGGHKLHSTMLTTVFLK